MDSSRRSERLETRLGHTFENQTLLRQALTHSSAAKDRMDSNERLEFLGDRVLGLCIADMLHQRFPGEPEGALGYRFTALARAETLAGVARDIGLGEAVVMSEGERETGGAAKEGILSDACEAVIAALYLDGGLAAARAFVHRYWEPLLELDPAPRKDPKTALQEWAQANGLALPRYEVTDRAGPDHAPVFTVQVHVDGAEAKSAAGPNKRAAEQLAAESLLDDLKRGDAAS